MKLAAVILLAACVGALAYDVAFIVERQDADTIGYRCERVTVGVTAVISNGLLTITGTYDAGSNRTEYLASDGPQEITVTNIPAGYYRFDWMAIAAGAVSDATGLTARVGRPTTVKARFK